MSYIPLDLTNYSGKYNLIINANTSSEVNGDYGYISVTSKTPITPHDSSSIGIPGYAGINTPRDYTLTLEGGKQYYLHFEYRKNGSVDSGEDKFIINSIRLELYQDDFLEDTEIVTNSIGKASIELKDGRYEITEIDAPEGYKLDSNKITYDFRLGQENELTVYNTPYNSKVIVHHYIKDTTIPVSDDEEYKGIVGDEYSTSPKVDLKRYQLIKDENGDYVIPDNASGVYTSGVQEVTYYYELKPLQLIVHHYLDGTEISVAPDENSEGNEGEEYNTQAASYPILDSRYELVTEKIPENANGILQDPVTEVIYYYKAKNYIITTEVDGIGGTISGQGLSQYEVVEHGKDSVKDIIVNAQEGYKIRSITINDDKIELPDGELKAYALDKFINMTEDKHIVVSFEIIKDNINVEKVWEDNNNEKGKRPDSVIVELYNGSTLVESGEVKALRNWKYTFENIPMYEENGNQITYTVKEKEKYTNDLELYDSVITTEDNKKFAIKNTFKIPTETKDIIVNKVWVDNNNENERRPSKIKIQLKNGEEILQEQEIDANGNTQSYTFTDLPVYDANTGEYIGYTIDEVESNEDDLKFYSKELLQPSNSNIVTITNTFTVPEDKISIDVDKKWIDNSNELETRPTQIKLQVKNGDTIVQEKIVNVDEDNEKVYRFENLAKYGSDGREISYSVDEVELRENELIGYEKSVNGNEITNTLKKHKITTEVKGDGGSISGELEEVYEEVYHKADSQKDIVIKPAIGYKIDKITINGEEIELPDDVLSENTLPKFNEVKEDKHIIVEFSLIEHVITTEVKGEGGTISGEGSTKENPYEIVLYGNDSVNDIKVIPEYGYKIKNIIINDENLEFMADEKGTYTLANFENMIEDKHIVVEFEPKETKIVVKYQTEDGIDLIEPKEIGGIVGEKYETEPKNFENYELIAMPENAEGNMTEDEIEIIYYYKKVEAFVIVKYLDEKTGEEIAKKEYLVGYIGEEYKTEAKEIENYTLVAEKIPENANGVYSKEVIEVIYYYNNMIEIPETADINVKLLLMILIVSLSGVSLKKKIKKNNVE